MRHCTSVQCFLLTVKWPLQAGARTVLPSASSAEAEAEFFPAARKTSVAFTSEEATGTVDPKISVRQRAGWATHSNVRPTQATTTYRHTMRAFCGVRIASCHFPLQDIPRMHVFVTLVHAAVGVRDIAAQFSNL